MIHVWIRIYIYIYSYTFMYVCARSFACVCSLQWCAYNFIRSYWLVSRTLKTIPCNHVQASLPSSLESLNSSGIGFRTPFSVCPFCRYLVGRCCTPLRLRIARLSSIIMSPGQIQSCDMCHAFYFVSTQLGRNIYTRYFAKRNEHTSAPRQLVWFIAEWL